MSPERRQTRAPGDAGSLLGLLLGNAGPALARDQRSVDFQRTMARDVADVPDLHDGLVNAAGLRRIWELQFQFGDAGFGGHRCIRRAGHACRELELEVRCERRQAEPDLRRF